MLKINTPDTYMYDHPHSWPGTGTSVKNSGGLKLETMVINNSCRKTTIFSFDRLQVVYVTMCQ